MKIFWLLFGLTIAGFRPRYYRVKPEILEAWAVVHSYPGKLSSSVTIVLTSHWRCSSQYIENIFYSLCLWWCQSTGVTSSTLFHLGLTWVVNFFTLDLGLFILSWYARPLNFWSSFWVYISCFFDPFVRLLDGVLISRSGSPKMSSQFSLGGSNAQLHGCQRDRLRLAKLLDHLPRDNRENLK